MNHTKTPYRYSQLPGERRWVVQADRFVSCEAGNPRGTVVMFTAAFVCLGELTQVAVVGGDIAIPAPFRACKT